LDRMMRQRPDKIEELFEELMEHFSAGHYRPLPFTEFPAANVAGALRFMSQRKNIGKVVVTLSEQAVSADVSESSAGSTVKPTFQIRADATYLITGGLGALGLQSAQWLAAQGARHIALLARSRPSSAVVESIESVRSAGAAVSILQGDVADRRSLDVALAKLPS